VLNLAMRGLERDMNIVEAALENAGSAAPGRDQYGPFGPALVRFYETVRTAEVKIAEIRGQLGREAKS